MAAADTPDLLTLHVSAQPGKFARTRMAKSVYDAGWSAFVRMLEYKAGLYGREFHRIGRYEPTSQTCSLCGVR